MRNGIPMLFASAARCSVLKNQCSAKLETAVAIRKKAGTPPVNTKVVDLYDRAQPLPASLRPSRRMITS